MGAEKKKQMGVLGLVVALVVVLFGGVLFVGAVSGWFDGSVHVKLDAEYLCGEECNEEFMELDANGYEELVHAGKSFIVFVDQDGCTTADRLREYVLDWANEAKVRVYRMMFSEVKESSLHEFVHYYPSVALISRGKVVGALQADSDADAPAYNDYEAFKEWLRAWL